MRRIFIIDFTNKNLFKLKKSSIAVPDVINKLLIPNEDVIGIYTARDYVIFTNKRIIAVNVQGITGKSRILLLCLILNFSCFQ
ncbi:MAG: PH domain-containing protein [Lachnospirales bacterium]